MIDAADWGVKPRTKPKTKKPKMGSRCQSFYIVWSQINTLSQKHTDTQKHTKSTRVQHDVLRDNKYGRGFLVNFIEMESPKTGFKGLGQMKYINVVSNQ